MSESFSHIDTDEIRAIMKKVSSISEDVRYLSKKNVSSMKGTVESNLEGEAADTLLTTLGELSGDIAKIANGLDAVKKALAAYVKAIEKADRELSKTINGNA